VTSTVVTVFVQVKYFAFSVCRCFQVSAKSKTIKGTFTMNLSTDLQGMSDFHCYCFGNMQYFMLHMFSHYFVVLLWLIVPNKVIDKSATDHLTIVLAKF
jgi:hypothetical protein